MLQVSGIRYVSPVCVDSHPLTVTNACWQFERFVPWARNSDLQLIQHQPGSGPNLTNGEEMCEMHGYNETECLAIGCCHWNLTTDNGAGACWSSVGRDPCFAGSGSGSGSGPDNGPPDFTDIGVGTRSGSADSSPPMHKVLEVCV